ncbi:hypothetical protein [Nocardia huaxiensis]|uniref:Uncharacterized protein n=1 Tax=Nocardia huaxiensis TaxID=2755382 RepID=A0A7D6VLE8_9NOCA|nr:hypothetical protein [Nocardia huaxiensis]QLY32476.1 hypothetical protein H0264_09595 [Nocardia huaxiensis]UFS93817.1 hypothetical protein LPY97_23850 [Nocardia huaxiensis]
MSGWFRAHRARAAGDYGLLVPAATVLDERAAHTVRQLLHAYGVRATTGRARAAHRRRNEPDRFRILVFPEDATLAYDVLSRHTS